MCGIAGAFAPCPGALLAPLVAKITASQRNRGPDREAAVSIPLPGGAAVLGHNRLAIIDLTPSADQPLWDASRRYCLAFNGEIYNHVELRSELARLGHRFETRSDSEVILESYKEWGTAAVERWNGMFALALLDAGTGRLLLVRDRFGVKPLYYRLAEGSLSFASTPDALAAHFHLRPDLAYVARGLRFGYFDEGLADSPFEGLSALPPAHLLEARLAADGVETELLAYYDATARADALREELAARPVSELAERLRAHLEDAVRLRLRSDVPVGVSLSGGLDSSIVAALAARRCPGLVGFTFGHPDHRGSEASVAAELARREGFRLRFVWPEPETIGASFREALRAQGAPFLGASIVAQHLVFRAARAEGVKVVLGGQGGDELFLGYRKYFAYHLRELLGGGRYGAALRAAAGLFPTVLAELPRAAFYWSQSRRYRGAQRPSALFLPEPAGRPGLPGGPVSERQLDDVRRYSLPTLLRYEDRNSMGNGVESRLPYLDYRVAEFALALPVAVKLRGGFGKWLLREAARGLVPERTRRARTKRNFDVNQAGWIRGGWGAALRAGVEERLPRLGGLLPSGTRVADAFSDERLTRDAGRVAEAVALVWLGDRLPPG